MESWSGRICCVMSALLTLPALHVAAGDLIWSPRADVIGESFGRGLHAAGVIGNVIYVAGGGYIGTSAWGSYQTALAYDPISDTWSARTPMPTKRTAPASAVANYMGQQRLYVIGGMDVTDIFWIESFPNIEEYDPITNTWRTVGAGMPDFTYSWGICAVVVDNLVYFMGGSNLSSTKARTVAYDPNLDSYTTLSSMPTGVSDGACAVFDGDIYYFGGYQGGPWGTAPGSSVFVYDIDTDSWQTLATPIPLPRANAAAIVIGDSVYIAGGWDGSGTSYGSFYNTIDAYDPVLDQWTLDVPDPLGCAPDDGVNPKGRSGLTLHLANDGVSDQVYAVGGNVGISVPTRCNESAPIVTDGLIFADSFETGTTSEWSSTQP